MFGKESDVRWNDTISYLNRPLVSPRLGDHINSIVPAGFRPAISKELSLGSRPDGKDDPGFAANSDKRHALRALLLCQRVYFSPLWTKDGPGPSPGNALAANWKQRSFAHWAGRSEGQIQDAIKMFFPAPGAKRSDLKSAAFAGPPNDIALDGNLTITRSDVATYGHGTTCYVGVQGWLVKSGLVSLRWFMMNRNPSNQHACDLIFTAGVEVWNGRFDPARDAKAVRGKIAEIPAGYIVHIWSPDNFNWNGHWVVTNGDGTICGVNNGMFLAKDAEKKQDVLVAYTRHSTLYEQFLGLAGGERGPGAWKTAVMAVIDPKSWPITLRL